MKKLRVLTMAIFLFCIVYIPFFGLKFLYYPIVYGAVISCGPAGPVLGTRHGTERDDNMKGDSDSNLLYGLGGDDQLDGGAGSDGLHGGSGDDELTAVPVMTFYMILQEKILLTVALAMIKL